MNGARAAVAPAAPTVDRVSAHVASLTWRRTTSWSVACVTLLDAVLLERKHGVLTGGFLATHQFGTFGDALAFLIMCALLNLTLAAPLTFAALRIGRRLRLRPRGVQFAAVCAAVLPIAIADFVNYQVWSYLGDAFDFHVMVTLAGQRMAEVIAVTAPLMARPLAVVAVGISAVVLGTALLHRADRRDAQSIILPELRQVAGPWLALLALASLTVIGVSMTSESMAFGLRATPSGQLFTTLLNRISDVDDDGFGLLQNPRDTAPFNGKIHPYAIDIPGNGIDEDGLAGDLPVQAAVPSSAASRTALWPRRPPVILFVLESVRADVVGATHRGHPVTPVLDRLAAGGLKVDDAWAHVAATSQSRYHILTGSLIDGRGSSTLLDDFKDHGYEVAYFSGQDDDFGSMGLDYRRVDKFYDARQDLARRYSTSTTPGSLAVPLSVVRERIDEYLRSRKTASPLFMYVNFHDTHYPYNHAGLENLLGVGLLAPSQISPGRRGALTSTYLNATANVDQAIGRVVDAVEAQTGQSAAVVIVGDHGESLFEGGVLGHGFALTEAQMKVPFIVRGLPVTITTPFGLSDLRATMNEALSREHRSDGPIARRGIAARVFQYLGTLDTPSQIGWNTASGLVSYDFRSDRMGVWDSSVVQRDLTGEPKRMLEDLVQTWERMLLARQ